MDNVLRRAQISNREKYLFECPGCGHVHCFYTSAETPDQFVCQWNRSWNYPTVWPSIIFHTPAGQCHLQIESGKIAFDIHCWHKRAGTIVQMIPWD